MNIKIGDVVRYGDGATALMRVDAITNGRAYGEQFFGGSVGAELDRCGFAFGNEIAAFENEYGRQRRNREPSLLSFATLRRANLLRLPTFKNAKGLPAHSEPDGSDWSNAQWLQAVVGELGELANIMKKVDRGDYTMDDARSHIADELADVQIYLDLLAFRLGVDLGRAVIAKFNVVSQRVGSPVRIAADGRAAS